MIKDKKELEALSQLCAENNVVMVRNLIPKKISIKRQNCRSGISSFRGCLWALRQVKKRAKFYKQRSKEKIGWDSLLIWLDKNIKETELKKVNLQNKLDTELKSSNHKINVDDNSNVNESSTIAKLSSKSYKPIPINKQTMKIIDYKKGDIYIK